MQRARATIADVAAAAGVSRTTVSVALSGKGRVDAATRDRVRSVAASLNYRPSIRAQRLRGGSSRTVGLVTALSDEVVGKDSHLSFLFALGVPLARVLLERGYSTLLLPPLKDGTHFDSVDADAIVVIDPRENDPLIESFRSRGLQVVTVGDAPGNDVNGVVDRGLSDPEVAIGHLTAAGASEIALLATSEPHSGASALRRFFLAHQDPAPRLHLVEVSVEDGEEGGYRRTKELLAAHPGIDAVYAPIDIFAVGALRAVKDLGRNVPGDVMVMTNFDGPRANASAPPLTSLDLDFTALAEAAAHLLIECLVSPQPERRVVIAPRPGLRVRESTTRA